ncbi:Transformer-2 protein-like alpha [Acipenser ruthenus]|uniref:Transformer-2 protein-like alpha n=1 Tax=Acipenser ruthenus TaxID=7906 RepID=A0A444TXG1_ACIRT|nr:Transformer-2 protein-like alpha [Acipenser ruthenus]
MQVNSTRALGQGVHQEFSGLVMQLIHGGLDVSTALRTMLLKNGDNMANPDPNTCLGVFGLSLYTTERDLREVFSRYGPLAGVNVVYDQRTGRSRGFSFVYFERIDDAKEAMERANGMELDGRRIRVDYSITKRAHTPTPGIYMGRPTQKSSYNISGRKKSVQFIEGFKIVCFK